MEIILAAITPFAITFIIWLSRSIFLHDNRIKSVEADVNDFKKIKISEKLADHEIRIKIQEKAHRDQTIKLDVVLENIAEIKGLLKSKKDKE